MLCAGLRGTWNGPSDLEVISTLDPRRMWKRIRKHAAQGVAWHFFCLAVTALCSVTPFHHCYQRFLLRLSISSALGGLDSPCVLSLVNITAALGELRLGLRDADLVRLKPGEQLLQMSSLVLLKGTLKTTGLAAKVPAGMPGALPVTPKYWIMTTHPPWMRVLSLLRMLFT